MGKTSISKILAELDEQGKLKKAPRTLHGYYVKLLTRDAKDKKEKEKIKKENKNSNGHYEIEIFYKPYYIAILKGLDEGLGFYEKIIQFTDEVTFEEIEEAFEFALPIFEEECLDDEHIQSMIYKYDEFTGFSLSIALENINRYLDAILRNTHEMTYVNRVEILKNVQNEFERNIFPESIFSTILNGIEDTLRSMGASEEEIKKEFSKVRRKQ